MSKDIAFPKYPPSTERRQGDSPTFMDADKLRAIMFPLVLHAVTLFLYKKLLGVCRQYKFGKMYCPVYVHHEHYFNIELDEFRDFFAMFSYVIPLNFRPSHMSLYCVLTFDPK